MSTEPKMTVYGCVQDAAAQVRDIIRQIAMDQELEIISGKVARDLQAA